MIFYILISIYQVIIHARDQLLILNQNTCILKIVYRHNCAGIIILHALLKPLSESNVFIKYKVWLKCIYNKSCYSKSVKIFFTPAF